MIANVGSKRAWGISSGSWNAVRELSRVCARVFVVALAYGGGLGACHAPAAPASVGLDTKKRSDEEFRQLDRAGAGEMRTAKRAKNDDSGTESRSVPVAADETARAAARLPVVRATGPRSHVVEEDGHYTGAEHEGPAQVEAKAIERALKKAVKRVVGVHVKDRFFHDQQLVGAKNSQILENFTALISDGVVLHHEVVGKPKCALERRRLSCALRVRAEILDRRGKRDTGFVASVMTDRSVYKHGDAAEITLRSSRDGFLLLLMRSGESISVLLPNTHEPSTRIAAGKELRFPSQLLRERRVRLRARLPEGEETAQEFLKLFVTKQPLSIGDSAPAQEFKESVAAKNDLFKRVYKQLVSMEADAWAEAKAVYTIRRR